MLHNLSFEYSPARFYTLVMVTLLLAFGWLVPGYAQKRNIKNDVFWDTKDGQPMYSQGGGIFRFKDPKTDQEKYYWYGVHYKEAEIYRASPNQTLPRASFESVTCYTSTDLVNWTFEADALA